jgi:signal transduction histidine kinase
VSLGDVLQSSAAVVQGLAAAQQKQLTVTLPAEKVLVTADEDKLVRAVVNILDNCLRYAEREVTLSLELEAGEQVKIVISDDGPGIPPQDLPHIFTRFFKGAGGQVGLGLAIAASIIERHGGAISAANTSHGAVFTIILPSGR